MRRSFIIELCIFILTLIFYIVAMPVMIVKRYVASIKRKRFLKKNLDYVDMYSSEGRIKISHYKFNTEVYEERVACNILLLSEPIKYIFDKKLTHSDLKHIMRLVKKIKDEVKVA